MTTNSYRQLYVAAGDASESGIAQNTDSLGGEILRLNLNGLFQVIIHFKILTFIVMNTEILK